MATTTPAAVRPPSRNFYKAYRIGWSFSCLSCVAPQHQLLPRGGHHSSRKRRKPPIVVPEIKPSALPPLVRRHKDGRDVLLRAPLPQLEGTATGPHRHTDLLHIHRQGEELHGEEVGPQIPMNFDPQKTLKTAAKMAACTMELGLRLCSSTP
jgi:hypothetical protein